MQQIRFPAHTDADIDDCIPRGVLERLRDLALIARLLEFDVTTYTGWRDPFFASDLLQTPDNLTRGHLRSGADRDVRANAHEWKLRGIVMRTAQPRKMKIRLW